MPRNLKTVVVHTAIWIFYTSFAIVVYGYGNIYGFLYETILSYAVSATIFYAHSGWLLPRFLERGRIGLYLSGITLLYVYNIAIRYGISFWLFPIIFRAPSSVVDVAPVRIILLFSWQWFTFMLFSTGYWFANKLIRTERSAREKEALEAEREKLLLENAALRAQINPHFLFNTLDSFRIESEDTFPNMARSISSLIDILRSTLSRPEADGLIPIEKEIRVVESLVNIYQRRFPSMFLQYSKEVPNGCRFRIPPHALLAFVENAFKHGAYNDPEKKLRIMLQVSEKGLLFHVFNKKNRRIKDDSHGIGMKYITRQLDNNYPDRYSLNIIDGSDDYTVNLKISQL